MVERPNVPESAVPPPGGIVVYAASGVRPNIVSYLGAVERSFECHVETAPHLSAHWTHAYTRINMRDGNEHDAEALIGLGCITRREYMQRMKAEIERAKGGMDVTVLCEALREIGDEREREEGAEGKVLQIEIGRTKDSSIPLHADVHIGEHMMMANVPVSEAMLKMLHNIMTAVGGKADVEYYDTKES